MLGTSDGRDAPLPLHVNVVGTEHHDLGEVGLIEQELEGVDGSTPPSPSHRRSTTYSIRSKGSFRVDRERVGGRARIDGAGQDALLAHRATDQVKEDLC